MTTLDVLPRKERFRLPRSVRVSAILLASAAVVYGAVKAFWLVRGTIRMEQHAREMAPREPAILAQWRADVGDPKTLLSSVPKEKDDAQALRLIELSKGLGITFARRAPSGDGHASNVATRNLEPFRSHADYDAKVFASPTSSIEKPPLALENFHQTQKEQIEAIVALLADSTPPRWASDASRGSEAPVPNLEALLRLERVLVTEALIRGRDGDVGGAERAFRAAWSLGRSLRDRPEVLSQLIAVSFARLHAGLARKLSVDPDEWLVRFQEHDYRDSMLKALAFEASGELEYLPSGTSALERASRADFLDLNRSALVRLRDSGIAELPTRKERQGLQEEREPLSPGQILAEISLSNLTSTWNRVDRLVLETELTEKILRLRKMRPELGRWPANVPGIEVSRAALGRWIYSVDQSGRMAIEFSNEPVWVFQYGLSLPFRYESD